MTRDEAINILYKKIRSYSGRIETNEILVPIDKVDDLIRNIFDFFEKERVCKNCKYFIESLGWCENMENGAMNDGAFISVNKDFGCNRFERRKNERLLEECGERV